MMFRSVEIPFRATILSAHIVFAFRSELNKSAAITAAITAKDEQNPSLPTACTGGTPSCCRGDVSSWSPRTTASVTWDGDDWPNGLSLGDPFDSIDFTSVIQELVDAFDYSAGADILLFAHSTGAGVNQHLDWEAFPNTDGAPPPKLVVEYIGGSPFSAGPAAVRELMLA